ncbi:PREDICTED: protein melted-like, partial [Priapulus caudatus]|uniref:Protein melted-like n=1 Tax=Priapulus caudatus TaxID=37621 RepID=A0ABM1EV28_PRICU
MPSNCVVDTRGHRTHKRFAKVYFSCAERGEHCLYNHTYLKMKTRCPRLWIHMMFLTLQARSEKPLTQEDQQVLALKSTWDSVKNDGKSFVALITSAFPSIKIRTANPSNYPGYISQAQQ